MDHSYALRATEAFAVLPLQRVAQFTSQQRQQTLALLQEEKERFPAALQADLLQVESRDQCHQRLQTYHATLIALHDTTLAKSQEATPLELQQLYAQSLSSLDALLHFVQSRYAAQLSLQASVPQLYQERARPQQQARLQQLEGQLLAQACDPALVAGLMKALHTYVMREPGQQPLTFQQVLHLQRLLTALEQGPPVQAAERGFSWLDAHLMAFQVNPPFYLPYVQDWVQAYLSDSEDEQEQLLRTWKLAKELKQLPQQVPEALYPGLETPREFLSRWLAEEIDYLEKKRALQQADDWSEPAADQSVQTTLTVTQLGLLLKVAFERKYLKATSLSGLFKRLAPYVATPQKAQVSAQSLRSNAYVVEEYDRKRLLEILNDLMKTIESYW